MAINTGQNLIDLSSEPTEINTFQSFGVSGSQLFRNSTIYSGASVQLPPMEAVDNHAGYTNLLTDANSTLLHKDGKTATASDGIVNDIFASTDNSIHPNEPKVEEITKLTREANETGSTLNTVGDVHLLIEADAQGDSQNAVGKVLVKEKPQKVKPKNKVTTGLNDSMASQSSGMRTPPHIPPSPKFISPPVSPFSENQPLLGRK